ncbi:hypothetical protein Rsub_04336 [Raphidocelis subcapitata]|uniref:SGNH hydrolase-type esterase domain-containing protein n=1 Tax=Raphidocelis subcapitata TaxID=307507 RepID=A0A2V0NVD4_9CHLO|nr:hypothetical protein Rsub_04336 [Raphidocelis subcapitata]|eukprot:GBF91596.1 hypothetical protein Rsub_04336 [Raphidocelis subcapitata]
MMARPALALALLALALVAAAAAPPKPQSPEAPEWGVYRKNIKALRLPNGRAVGDLLGPLLDYKFDLPMEFIRRAQSYTGPRTRLRRVVSDMLAGKPVEVSVLGGSVSAGAIASRKMAAVDPNDVWNLVRIQLQDNLSPKIEFYNNARSATKSYINSLCLSRFLNSTADLVFVEFIANDGSEMDTQLQGPLDKTRSFERFLRKIQGQPSAPAVVMMNMLVSEMAYPPTGMNGKPKRAFYSTPEDTYGNLAQYYDIPTISYRDALWQLGDNNLRGMAWSDFLADDRLHPNDRGHRLMADMVIYLVQQAALDVLLHPVTPAEAAASKGPLRPPMFAGNEASLQQMCAQGKNMSTYVAESAGWAVVPYDKGTKYPTFGFETATPGAPLVLELDTTASPPANASGVILTYTKAHTGFGNAKVTCSNGCECKPTTLEGSVPYDQTVYFLEELHPTPAPKCHVSIELDRGSPAGSRVRISGVITTADPGHIAGRVGEEKYMGWLSGDKWAV